jgi:hypothetical protein
LAALSGPAQTAINPAVDKAPVPSAASVAK